MENWRDVPGYEGLYQVSDHGNVRSIARRITDTHCTRHFSGRLLKQFLDHNGYKVVTLSKQGLLKQIKVHRLVAMAFIPNPKNYPQVNHKDEDATNNLVCNLEWCDGKYNSNYGTRNARMSHTKKISKQQRLFFA